MRAKFNSYLGIFLLAAAVAFMGCEGKDGDPGPKGDTGVNGEKGDKGDTGAKGDQGDKGEGFDEATALGNVKLTIAGIDPNGQSFSKELNFKYALSDFNYSYTGTEGENFRYFYGLRFNHPISETYYFDQQLSYAEISLGVYKENGVTTFSPSLYFTTQISNNLKFFNLRLYEYFSDDETSTVSNYSYDESKGQVKYNFSMTIPGDYNNSYNDITVTGVVDFIVQEELEYGGLRIGKRLSDEEVKKAFANELKK